MNARGNLASATTSCSKETNNPPAPSYVLWIVIQTIEHLNYYWCLKIVYF